MVIYFYTADVNSHGRFGYVYLFVYIMVNAVNIVFSVKLLHLANCDCAQQTYQQIVAESWELAFITPWWQQFIVMCAILTLLRVGYLLFYITSFIY